ncbi:MAG: hypothetical protein MZU97_12665 [Bacillus subtilis]|nr:hypothetical protein [Bacillus subtilis]
MEFLPQEEQGRADRRARGASEVRASVIVVDGETGPPARRTSSSPPGSRPREIPGFEFDEKDVLSSTGALMLEKLPQAPACILGAGAIGVEFAYVMNAFGVRGAPWWRCWTSILPARGRRGRPRCWQRPSVQGVETIVVYPGRRPPWRPRAAGTSRPALAGQGGRAQDGRGRQAPGGQSAGRPTPRASAWKAMGIKTERGFIPVGDYVPDLGAGRLRHRRRGGHPPAGPRGLQGRRDGGGAHGRAQRPRRALDPSERDALAPCTREPQVASFGLTEEGRAKAGIEFDKASLPLPRGRQGRGRRADPKGMVKILYDPESRRDPRRPHRRAPRPRS